MCLLESTVRALHDNLNFKLLGAVLPKLLIRQFLRILCIIKWLRVKEWDRVRKTWSTAISKGAIPNYHRIHGQRLYNVVSIIFLQIHSIMNLLRNE